MVDSSRATLQAYGTVQAANKLAAGFDYPNSRLAQSLQLAAKLIRKDPYVRVITTIDKGYHNHQNQAKRQNALLAGLSDALFSFWKDLRESGISQRVIVLVWSELDAA